MPQALYGLSNKRLISFRPELFSFSFTDPTTLISMENALKAFYFIYLYHALIKIYEIYIFENLCHDDAVNYHH